MPAGPGGGVLATAYETNGFSVFCGRMIASLKSAWRKDTLGLGLVFGLGR